MVTAGLLVPDGDVWEPGAVFSPAILGPEPSMSILPTSIDELLGALIIMVILLNFLPELVSGFLTFFGRQKSPFILSAVRRQNFN
jgi:hypothetical protein